MKLSKAMIEVLKELNHWFNSRQREWIGIVWLDTTERTLGALESRGLAKQKHFSQWQITPAGIAALEEAERENGIL